MKNGACTFSSTSPDPSNGGSSNDGDDDDSAAVIASSVVGGVLAVALFWAVYVYRGVLYGFFVKNNFLIGNENSKTTELPTAL
jgi:hypothetical protein